MNLIVFLAISWVLHILICVETYKMSKGHEQTYAKVAVLTLTMSTLWPFVFVFLLALTEA